MSRNVVIITVSPSSIYSFSNLSWKTSIKMELGGSDDGDKSAQLWDTQPKWRATLFEHKKELAWQVTHAS